MKDRMLSQEQLNKIYQKWNVNNSLADFLYDCNDRLHHGEMGFYYDDLEQLSNEQLTCLVDWWNGKHSNEQQSIVVGYVLKFGDKYAQQIKQELQTNKMHLTITLTTKQSKALVIQDSEIAKSYAKIFYGKLGTVKIDDKL